MTSRSWYRQVSVPCSERVHYLLDCRHIALQLAGVQTEANLPLRLCLVTPLKREERALVALAALV